MRGSTVAASLVVFSTVAVQGTFVAPAAATHLDGTQYHFDQQVVFKVKSKFGKATISLPLLGDTIRFGGNGPGTFEFLDAGIDDDGPGTADDDDLEGTYGPAGSTGPSAPDDTDDAQFDADSKHDIAGKVIGAVQGAAAQMDDCSDPTPNADVILNIPALETSLDAEGRIIMDLPALKLVGPKKDIPGSTIECNGVEHDLKGKSGKEEIVGDPDAPTGASSGTTAAKGVAIAVATGLAAVVLRRRSHRGVA